MKSLKEAATSTTSKAIGTVGSILVIVISGFSLNDRVARLEDNQTNVLKFEEKLEIIHNNNERIYNYLLPGSVGGQPVDNRPDDSF